MQDYLHHIGPWACLWDYIDYIKKLGWKDAFTVGSTIPQAGDAELHNSGKTELMQSLLSVLDHGYDMTNFFKLLPLISSKIMTLLLWKDVTWSCELKINLFT